MRIDPEVCISCGDCIVWCPLGAISMEDVAVVDGDECVECGACVRADVCPVDAFRSERDERPYRSRFSDPSAAKPTGIAGRGTEEMKTNDVTGRFKRGRVGICIEPGRPGTGARFRDIEKITMTMARLGARFEPANPLTRLICVRTGKLQQDIHDEKVMSVVIECDFPETQLQQVLDALDAVASHVDCVFSLSCIGRAKPDGRVPLEHTLRELGIAYRPNGKTNLGMGRPLAAEVHEE